MKRRATTASPTSSTRPEKRRISSRGARLAGFAAGTHEDETARSSNAHDKQDITVPGRHTPRHPSSSRTSKRSSGQQRTRTSPRRLAPCTIGNEALAQAEKPSSSPKAGNIRRRRLGSNEGRVKPQANGEAGVVDCRTVISPALLGAGEARKLEIRYSQGAENGAVDLHVSTPARSLVDMFEALDQVLHLFRRRRQAALLQQVRGTVEGMCGRSFSKRHLAQILFVQPDAYVISTRVDARPTRGGYRLRDLLIEPGDGGGSADEIAADVAPKEIVEHKEPSRESGGSLASPTKSRRGTGTNGVPCPTVTMALRRRDMFRGLVSAARARYCKCSSDQGCACIPEAPLPDTSPVADDEGGRWIQSSARKSLKSERPVQASLDTSGVDDRKDNSLPTDVEALRLRLREKDRLSALELSKSEEEREVDRRRRANLPAVADVVRSYFAHARRSTCALDAVVGSLCSSRRLVLSAREARERLRMLAHIVPEWCEIIAPRPASSHAAGSGVSAAGDGASLERHHDEDLGLARTKPKDVVRVNTQIHFREVRQMIVFMSGCANSEREAGGSSCSRR